MATALTIGNISQNLSKVAKLPRRKIDSRIESVGGGYNFCFVPTYVNAKPQILTGLGDTFAAVQATAVLGWWILPLEIKFLADSMLGRLGRWLRMLGFDTDYKLNEKDNSLINLAEE